jgi:hypothetical protein
MKISHSNKFGLLVLVSAFALTSSVLPALAKDKTPKPIKEKYSVVQQGQTPIFTVTNNKKNAKEVDFEFDLVDAQGRTEYSYIQNDQKLKAGASQNYNMGPLMLTPASSPYHVVFKVISVDKKHKLIETVDPAGTFTVVH